MDAKNFFMVVRKNPKLDDDMSQYLSNADFEKTKAGDIFAFVVSDIGIDKETGEQCIGFKLCKIKPVLPSKIVRI